MKLWSNFTIPRRCSELITEPCQMKLKVTIQGQSSYGNILCPLYNFKTFKDLVHGTLYKYKASLDSSTETCEIRN